MTEIFPVSLQVLLSDVDLRAVLFPALFGATVLAAAAVGLGRPRATVAVVALSLSAALLPWVAYEVVAGKPRLASLEYVVGRYGPAKPGEETKVKILRAWVRGKGKPIGILIDRPDDDRDPEWLLVPWDEKLAKRLRQLQAEAEGAGKGKGRKKMGIRMRIRARSDREMQSQGRKGGRRRYERNWERFDIRYELDWPEMPPPKSPEEGGVSVG